MSANPYWLFSWHDLGRVCADVVDQLERVVPTRERADLDTRLVNLLRELERRIRPEPTVPWKPEWRLRDGYYGGLADAYWLQAETNLRNTRLRELDEAASYVLGGYARTWTHNVTELDGFENSAPFVAAGKSEEGLRAAFLALQRVARERGKTHEPANRIPE